MNEAICGRLTALYGEAAGRAACRRLAALMESARPRIPRPASSDLSQRDSILITYGDQIQTGGEPPLRTLAAFCNDHLRDLISGIHILPFYPWTSDDGFSVKDYRAVDPALGDWPDVAALGKNFRLMFDGVINHISAQSEWFQAFLRDEPRYRNYFIVVDGSPDLSQVVRPRTLPLLTDVQTAAGPKRVWTTFSADQVDLNFANPDVLLDIIEVLLQYARHGAHFIRLDAIAYLWKEIGTPCIHLPQTHRIIQLLRAVLDETAPHIRLITETNVPHADNISYFGNGQNEAQLVYNFALPPLTLHTLQTGNAAVLSRWAATLALPSDRTTFFNFLASHDGIGLTPARGLLTPEEIETMIERVRAHGGLVSYKANPDRTQSPYELNVNYFDALSDPAGAEPLARQVDRFVAAHAIMFSLVGVPGIYFHSLFGSRGWPEGVRLTGRNRTLNRRKLDRAEVEADLRKPGSLRAQVFNRLSRLLKIRAGHPAFHPHGRQEVVEAGEAVFALWRTAPADGGRVLCLQNVSGRPQTARLDGAVRGGLAGAAADLVTGATVNIGSQYVLAPYQTVWLTQA